MKNTLIVNFFGGPGTGKSTFASGVFSKLKHLNYNVEYVQEFAKKLTWEKNNLALDNQFYVSGTQSYFQNMLIGQVDAVITDSPLLIGLLYYRETNEKVKTAFEKFVIESFNAQNNVNIFINRKKKYNPAGRNQTGQEAIEIDEKILKLLRDNNIPFYIIGGDEYGMERSVDEVISALDVAKRFSLAEIAGEDTMPNIDVKVTIAEIPSYEPKKMEFAKVRVCSICGMPIFSFDRNCIYHLGAEKMSLKDYHEKKLGKKFDESEWKFDGDENKWEFESEE